MLTQAACLLAAVTAVLGNIVVYTQLIPHRIVDEFRDEPSSFGDTLPPDGLRGLLAPGSPTDGCTALAKPPSISNFTGKWIVLVARFNCSFEVKVRNAQDAGYDLAIVHNVNSDDLENMSAKNPVGITIPSVFVSELTGQILTQQYLYSDGYYLLVNGDAPFDINTHLLLPFAVVVALCLLVMLIFMIVKCVNDRRRARRHRLPSRALRKIPTCKFSKSDPYDTCAICLDDYQEGERLRVLPCAHAYHAKCIDPWLTQNRRVCPVCKRRVLAAGERRVHSESDSDDSHSPLVADADTTPTQGGTFEPQRENPFMRAARFMARLRRRNPDAYPGEEAAPSEDADAAGTAEQNDDTEPLIPALQPATVTSQRERPRTQRGRRHRRTRSESAPSTHPAGSGPSLRPLDHSINTPRGESRGEIGVAALPAPRPVQPARTPHHLRL